MKKLTIDQIIEILEHTEKTVKKHDQKDIAMIIKLINVNPAVASHFMQKATPDTLFNDLNQCVTCFANDIARNNSGTVKSVSWSNVLLKNKEHFDDAIKQYLNTQAHAV